MKRPNRSICAALVVSFLLVSSRAAEAGREMVPWDSLPQIETFVFSGTDLGLISMDNRRFTFHTKTDTLQEISETEFQRRFPYTMSPRARKVVKETGVGSEVLLRTSQSLVFTTRNAYCSEGDHTTHWLSLEGKPLKDFVKPCHSISTVEQVGDQLWLGTRYDGVYGDGEAEGIIIQSKDGTRKIGQISTQDGLTGNLVRAIRINPLDSLVWVATNQGLNAVASDLKIVKSVYFYQDFDPVTGAPIYLASPTFRENPMIVELVRQLRLSDYKAFRDAWRTIPKQAADKMVFGMIDNAYSCENVLNGNEAFAPSETNVLAPFFIEASRSMDDPTRYLAFRALGSLNDPRAVARFVELRSNCPGCGAIDEEIVSKYLDKYAYFYLLPKKEPNELALELQEGLQSALQAISNKGQCPSRQQPMATVVQNALRLKKMADPFGMNKINEYFKASDGNDEDASFLNISDNTCYM